MKKESSSPVSIFELTVDAITGVFPIILRFVLLPLKFTVLKDLAC